MTCKRIGNLERMLISECVKDEPSFESIQRLFTLGADANAVNGLGECVLAVAAEGYCQLHGANLRSGFFMPMIVEAFIENGFSVRRHGLKVISELQNGIYDKYMRRAIRIILAKRRECAVKELRELMNTVKIIASGDKRRNGGSAVSA